MQLSQEQQQLVEDNMALVRTVITDRIFGIRGIGIFTYDDLFQIGCIGLCKAAYTDKYQYAYNRENTHSQDKTCFTTYAYRLILNEILTKLSSTTSQRAEMTVEQDALIKLAHAGSMQVMLDEEIARVEFEASLEVALKCAEKRASGVTAKGIQALVYTSKGYTSTEIAKMMGGISCHNVTAWISKARRFLKEDPVFNKLLSST